MQANYGFDAPGVIKGLLGGSLAAFAVFSFLSASVLGVPMAYLSYLALLVAIVLGILGISMVVYGLVGKHRVRDFMVSELHLKGDETILDVGTGRGLLAIGAAKKLTHGKAIGIDLWVAEDLSGNSAGNAKENARIEGVSERVEIQDGNVCQLAFPDNHFDGVLSQFCIHNIEDKAEQKKACFEIARVMKPGAIAVIGDYIPTHTYAGFFKEAGLEINYSKQFIPLAFSLTWILKAVKPSA